MNTFARRLALALLLPCAVGTAHAQCISLTSPGCTASENFDTLSATAGSTTNALGVPGWAMTEAGGGARDNEQYAVDTGGSTTGDTYSYGSAGSSDRALGSLRSGTLISSYGACYVNNTGAPLTTLGVAYAAEQWRVGVLGRLDQVAFEYSTDATSLATGVWTNVTGLGFITPDIAARNGQGVVGSRDGNASAMRLAVEGDISGLSIAEGATVWIRWSDLDAQSSDDGMAIDDVVVTAGPNGGSQPVLSIADQARRERNAMSQTEAFSVQLSQPAGVGGVSFSYTVTAGTATSGVDYIGTGGNATIPEGSSTGFVSFAITGDTDIEGDETVLVTLGNIVGASAGDTAAVITITDDDAPPPISISDTSAAEGDSGTKEFLFTISLGGPAPQGGVSVDYATADGTAAAGSDYVAKSATASIAEGQTSITIGVNVNGDGDIEGNATFFVNLSNAVGGTFADSQGVGTITNDDVVITPIHDIQGAGASSPHVGQALNTRGIVTGRKSNGFFLQSSDADADADPATSEGIFVFTSTTPPAAAAMGNLVRVSGTVIEFVPSQDPLQAPLTELGGPLTVSLLTTDNPLPTPVQLTTSFPSPDGGLDQLERVEGMRVTADSFTVVAATGGNTDENDATGSSNGQVNLVVTGTPRPFREPGIQAPDPAPAGGSIPPIPRWDFNPELLFSDTDALGGTRLDLAVGATLGNYVGPLDYGFRRYSVHQDPTVTPTVTQGPAPSAARVPGAKEFTVASYNLERFFDTVNDPATDDPVLTSNAFSDRLVKASLGIRNFLHTPDILAVMEVENLSTLQMLSTRISSDAMTAGQPNPRYVAYLAEGNDVGGIDVGFLVKTGEVADGVARVEVVGTVTQLGADTTWNDPVNGPDTLLNDRPPLLLDAVVHFVDGREFPVTVIAVHQRSLNGADTDDAGGSRTRTKRQLQADFLADQIQGMQEATPERRIVVAGDFNAFEFNDGLVDAMGTVTGLPSPDDATAVANDGIDRVSPDLLNLYIEEPADQRYSFEFDGNAQSLDHILVNQALGAAASSVDLDHARINSDFPEILRGDMSTVARLADHDPAVAYFNSASADLSVTLGSPLPANGSPGEPMTFTAFVTNNGPDAALFPGVGFAFDAELPDLAFVSTPQGWVCDPPSVDAGTTIVACAVSSMTASGQDSFVAFQLTATAPASEAGNPITLVVSVDAQTADPDMANNTSVRSIDVTSADLGITIQAVHRSAGGRTYNVTASNAGPSGVSDPVVTIEAGIPYNGGLLAPPPNWTCDKDPARFRYRCFLAPGNALESGTATLPFTLWIYSPNDKSSYRLEADVESSITSDPDLSNNTRVRRLGLPN